MRLNDTPCQRCPPGSKKYCRWKTSLSAYKSCKCQKRYPRFPSYLCHRHPSSSKRPTALAMLDVVIPTCRAIPAIDNPNSSTPRFAILARTALTFLRRLLDFKDNPRPPVWQNDPLLRINSGCTHGGIVPPAVTLVKCPPRMVGSVENIACTS